VASEFRVFLCHKRYATAYVRPTRFAARFDNALHSLLKSARPGKARPIRSRRLANGDTMAVRNVWEAARAYSAPIAGNDPRSPQDESEKLARNFQFRRECHDDDTSRLVVLARCETPFAVMTRELCYSRCFFFGKPIISREILA